MSDTEIELWLAGGDPAARDFWVTDVYYSGTPLNVHDGGPSTDADRFAESLYDDQFASAAHIERYNGNAAKVAGSVRLAPESTEALQRQITRTPRSPAPRQPRGPLMQQRMAQARRDVLRRIGNIA
jgi:hypothetical protein